MSTSFPGGIDDFVDDVSAIQNKKLSGADGFDHPQEHVNLGDAIKALEQYVLDDAADLLNHINDSSAAHAASAISFVPNGSIASSNVQAAIQEVRDEAGGSVLGIDFLVGTAQTGLDSEIVVGTSPGGELGGTWASPTIDVVHSGSSHASIQAAAEAAAEATAAAALASHEADTTNIHGITNTALLETTAGAQTKVDLHVNDTSAAHAASAISFTPNGSISSTDVQAAIQEVRDEAGSNLSGIDFLVGSSQGSLSAEIVVGTSPGGELGGTWASPTVDATHSGSSHASVQAAAEATAAGALASHEADTTNIHGIANTALLETTSGAQTKVDLHVNDTSAAHAASSISFIPNGSISSTDVQAAIQEVRDEAGFDLSDIDFLVGTTQAGLSAEIVVGNSPGGELGGTWAFPTVDVTHSGSSHASVQAAAEATAASALSAHVAAGDPHPVYLTATEGNAAYDALGAASTVNSALTAHLNDTSDAHDASAISILDTANDFTATDVEGALAELQSDAEADAADLASHIADATDAHGASAISFTPNGSISSSDVQAAIQEVRDEAGGGSYGWYQTAELVDDVIEVTFTTPFGIDITTGEPYFDPGNVTPGEEAVLLPDLTLMQPGS